MSTGQWSRCKGGRREGKADSRALLQRRVVMVGHTTLLCSLSAPCSPSAAPGALQHQHQAPLRVWRFHCHQLGDCSNHQGCQEGGEKCMLKSLVKTKAWFHFLNSRLDLVVIVFEAISFYFQGVSSMTHQNCVHCHYFQTTMWERTELSLLLQWGLCAEKHSCTCFFCFQWILSMYLNLSPSTFWNRERLGPGT